MTKLLVWLAASCLVAPLFAQSTQIDPTIQIHISGAQSHRNIKPVKGTVANTWTLPAVPRSTSEGDPDLSVFWNGLHMQLGLDFTYAVTAGVATLTLTPACVTANCWTSPDASPVNLIAEYWTAQ